MRYIMIGLLVIVGLQSLILSTVSYQLQEAMTNLHEYQIELEMDSAALYDHGRYVGSYYFPEYIDDFRGIDSLFMIDNQ